MRDEKVVMRTHLQGELQSTGIQSSEPLASVDTFAGKIHVKWVPDGAVSSLGMMAFFIEFLKTSGLFDKWVEDCPLQYSSNNAPKKRDVLGTILLAVLAGQWRYPHISAVRGAGVNPECLGILKSTSDDSVSRELVA